MALKEFTAKQRPGGHNTGDNNTAGRGKDHREAQTALRQADGKDGVMSSTHCSRENSRPPGEDRAALTGPSGRTESQCPREEAVQLQGASVGPLGCPTGRAQRLLPVAPAA